MAQIKMPTPAEIAGMWQASGLKNKLLFTFMVIAVFRFGTQIPIFGINLEAFNAATSSALVGFLDVFTGGALAKVSIFALGIGPYITASIIMQLMSAVIPHLEDLQKEEGESGRRQIAQYTRYLAVGLCIFQSFMFLMYLLNSHLFLPNVNIPLTIVGGMTSLIAGSMFIMWISELITERGIGNGASLIIFIGIISRLPIYFEMTGKAFSEGVISWFGLLALTAIFLATIGAIIIMQEAVRKVIIVNARRQVGNKVYGGVNTHIPFKLNPGGVMPIIFAVAILLFPTTILDFLIQNKSLGSSGIFYNVATFLNLHVLNPKYPYYYIIYFLLIMALSFFYASIMPNMQPKEIATNLKKHGSSIPGIKPGIPTAEVLDKILTRIIFIGSLGLGLIAIIPSVATALTGIDTLKGLGATTLIIMVGVALDFVNQIKTHLLVRQYEGFLKQ